MLPHRSGSRTVSRWSSQKVSSSAPRSLTRETIQEGRRSHGSDRWIIPRSTTLTMLTLRRDDGNRLFSRNRRIRPHASLSSWTTTATSGKRRFKESAVFPAASDGSLASTFFRLPEKLLNLGHHPGTMSRAQSSAFVGRLLEQAIAWSQELNTIDRNQMIARQHSFIAVVMLSGSGRRISPTTSKSGNLKSLRYRNTECA